MTIKEFDDKINKIRAQIGYARYKVLFPLLKWVFKDRCLQTKQMLLKILPSGVLRFDLTSYFRSLE